MKVIKSVCFLACFLLCSLVAHAQEKPTERTTIPLMSLKGDERPLIQVKLNGQLVCILCVDTGSGISLLTEETAKKLSLVPKPAIGDDGKPISLSYIKGKTADFVGVNRVEVGTLALDRCAFVLVPDKLFHEILSPNTDGLIGLNILEKLALLIDHEGMEITLWKQGNLTGEQRKSVHMDTNSPLTLQLRENGLFLSAHFNGQTEALLLDTGGANTSISAGLAKRLALSLDKEPKKYQGVNGIVAVETIHVGQVEVGKTALKNMAVIYPKAEEQSLTPKLGMDYLSKFRVLLDFPQKRLYLQPAQMANRPSDPKVGAGFQIKITADKKIILEEITAGAPAEEAGMKVGDELVEVNGKLISSLTLHELGQEIRQPEGTKVTFKIQRIGEDKPREVTLTVKKLP